MKIYKFYVENSNSEVITDIQLLKNKTEAKKIIYDGCEILKIKDITEGCSEELNKLLDRLSETEDFKLCGILIELVREVLI